jgi:hypothetical protein
MTQTRCSARAEDVSVLGSRCMMMEEASEKRAGVRMEERKESVESCAEQWRLKDRSGPHVMRSADDR